MLVLGEAFLRPASYAEQEGRVELHLQKSPEPQKALRDVRAVRVCKVGRLR